MGSVIAQRVWRQHPDAVGGLVLAASTAHFRTNGRERVFHAGMELGMGLSSTLSRSRVVRRASRPPSRRSTPTAPTPLGWAMRQWRSQQPVGRRPGRGVPRPAPLDSLAVAGRRAHRGRRDDQGPGDPAGSPARHRRADPGRHGARGCVRARRLRAGAPGVRTGAPRSSRRRRPYACANANRHDPAQPRTALRIASSSIGNWSTRSHTCGISSLHAMAPMCICPLLLITVMLSPAPWKIGPSG